MPCFKPLKGFRALRPNPSGKYSIVFSRRLGYEDLPMQVPCGRCIGCRLMRSKQWAVRCMHEASLHEDNCFITLTFDDKHLPQDNSLHKEDFQKFMKRLRKEYPEKTIRYYHCGEYGEKYSRPHHHACIFGFDFKDKVLQTTKNGSKLYVSPTLEKLWKNGYHTIGEVTYESAAYVARYITKKYTGKFAYLKYEQLEVETGEITDLLPEYNTMSRKPGIGKGWYDKYKSDLYPDDFVIVNGKKHKVPKFYDTKYEIEFPDEMKSIVQARQLTAWQQADNNTPERLEVREAVAQAKFKQTNREYEK